MIYRSSAARSCHSPKKSVPRTSYGALSTAAASFGTSSALYGTHHHHHPARPARSGRSTVVGKDEVHRLDGRRGSHHGVLPPPPPFPGTAEPPAGPSYTHPHPHHSFMAETTLEEAALLLVALGCAAALTAGLFELLRFELTYYGLLSRRGTRLSVSSAVVVAVLFSVPFQGFFLASSCVLGYRRASERALRSVWGCALQSAKRLRNRRLPQMVS